jgi:DNA polymerase
MMGLIERELVCAAAAACCDAIRLVFDFVDEAELQRTEAQTEDAGDNSQGILEPETADETKWDWNEEAGWDSSEREKKPGEPDAEREARTEAENQPAPSPAQFSGNIAPTSAPTIRIGGKLVEEGVHPDPPPRAAEQSLVARYRRCMTKVAEKREAEWDAAREGARNCRACDLWKPATQTVFGEGPIDAPLMFVGEQPGDREDLAGKPFVGPAGGILDRGLAEAGIARDKAYVTNAVKHFKFARRGKIRLHQKPDIAEIKACNPWLARERAIIRPALMIALGATAARAVFGKTMPIGRNRGRVLDLDAGAKALITVHPSYLLRVEDADKDREFALFVADLKLAAPFAR